MLTGTPEKAASGVQSVPLRERAALALGVRWRKWLPWIPFPVRLSFGSWWLVRPNQMGETLFWYRSFGDEGAAFNFVDRFLKPGMTVVDAGAHEGYYTLFASRRVGRRGRVITFEPSPRERKALRWHLRINRCSNVTVESTALGSQSGESQLHVVEDTRTGYNSLRPPAISAKTRSVTVRVARLDDCLRRLNIDAVDFLKLDVEGAELSVLNGATELLARRPRPVILAEVEDARTAPWGYRAREIVAKLAAVDYRWFEPRPDSTLAPLDPAQDSFQANLVAVPRERIEQILPSADSSGGGLGKMPD